MFLSSRLIYSNLNASSPFFVLAFRHQARKRTTTSFIEYSVVSPLGSVADEPMEDNRFSTSSVFNRSTRYCPCLIHCPLHRFVKNDILFMVWITTSCLTLHRYCTRHWWHSCRILTSEARSLQQRSYFLRPDELPSFIILSCWHSVVRSKSPSP